MIILYWIVASAFGSAGMLGCFEFSPMWFLAELGGFFLIGGSVAFGKKRLADFFTPIGLCFIAWTFYANIYYLVNIFIDFNDGFSFDQNTINLGFFLSFTSVCIFGALFELSSLYRRNVISPVTRFSNRKKYIQPFPMVVVIVIAVIVGAYVVNLLSSGVLAMIGKESRLTLANATETGKVWLLYYILTGATLYCLYAAAVSGLHKIANRWKLVSLLVFFWSCYLITGNRRGLITVLLASAIVFVWNRRLEFKHFATGASVVFALLGFGALRQLSGSAFSNLDAVFLLINSVGEFYFPHITLLHSISNLQHLQLGSSMVSWFPDFIAAVINSDNYLFLAQKFALEVAPVGAESYMGYAYMPLTEAYINFGIAGAIIAPILLVSFLRTLEEVFGRKSFPVLVISAMAIDINRGDFGAIIMQYFFMLTPGLFLLMTAYISDNLRIRKRSGEICAD